MVEFWIVIILLFSIFFIIIVIEPWNVSERRAPITTQSIWITHKVFGFGYATSSSWDKKNENHRKNIVIIKQIKNQ